MCLFDRITKVNSKDIDIDSSSVRAWSLHPDELGSGECQYQGQTYNFKVSHEFDDGNTYIIYHHIEGNALFYFTLTMDDPRIHYNEILSYTQKIAENAQELSS